jgi:hypothetical protein
VWYHRPRKDIYCLGRSGRRFPTITDTVCRWVRYSASDITTDAASASMDRTGNVYCSPSWLSYTYFSNTSFPILHTSLEYMYVYCRYKWNANSNCLRRDVLTVFRFWLRRCVLLHVATKVPATHGVSPPGTLNMSTPEIRLTFFFFTFGRMPKFGRCRADGTLIRKTKASLG